MVVTPQSRCAPTLVTLVCLLASSSAVAQVADQSLIESFGPTWISWTSNGPVESATLTIRRSGATAAEEVINLGPDLRLDLSDRAVWSDGSYSYELSVVGVHTPGQEYFDGREGNTPALRERGPRVASAPSPVTQRVGSFTITGGEIPIDADEGEARPRDQVILDDLIVDGSACIGFDCVNGEAFGFDTLRLKENNIRVHFHDTSSSASFPTNDWRLVINDTSNGGASHFSIDDVDAGRTPFRVKAGANNWSVLVDTGGRVGFGTSTPVVELHSASGDTPTLRLEQNGSMGYTAQTWDVAGNEANFFIRDVSNGSRLPLRIRPGAPTGSIDVASSGNLGIGTQSPAAAVHVLRSNGMASLLIQETSSAVATRNLLQLENSGQVQMTLRNSNSGQRWKLGLDQVDGQADSFVISRAGTGGPELAFLTSGDIRIGAGASAGLRIAPNGNVNIAGTLAQGSSRAIKENFKPLSARHILEKVSALPLSAWNYKSDGPAIRHLGPMAEDFWAEFQLGADAEHLAPSDVAGVALAAIQGLREEVSEKDRQIEELSARVEMLERLVARLAYEKPRSTKSQSMSTPDWDLD